MKFYLYLAAFISLTFWGCREKSNPINPVDDGSLIISGHIINSYCDSSNIYTTSFPNQDSSLTREAEVNIDTSFILKIPVPAEDYLSAYKPYNKIIVINNDSVLFIDSIRIADPDMKYIRFDLSYQCFAEIIYALDISAATIIPSNWAKEGDYYISYYYINSETTIQGYHKLKTVAGDLVGETITEYDVTTQKGWNKLITRYKSKGSLISIYSVTNYTSEKADWIVGSRGLFGNYKLF